APDITQAITLVQKTAAQLSLLAGADVVNPD
ncbi:IclR family transcriptional regulator, partial [Rhizobium ruizarguesonis]